MPLKNKNQYYTALFFTFICALVSAQKNSVIITGKIYSSNKQVSDVHIINLNNRHGTISNSNGEFEIKVALKDSLLISSIQYQSLIIGITDEHLNSKSINIHLKSVINELDEVFLHNLSGNLNSDLSKTPKDTLPKHSFMYKLSDLGKKLPGDEYGTFKRPNAESFTNPLYLANGGQGSKFDRRLEAKLKLKRELRNKIAFPSKIKQELGIDFFTKTLKIPKEKINHFLSFCEYRNIINYHNKNNLLEVIKILREESKNYHEIEN